VSDTLDCIPLNTSSLMVLRNSGVLSTCNSIACGCSSIASRTYNRSSRPPVITGKQQGMLRCQHRQCSFVFCKSSIRNRHNTGWSAERLVHIRSLTRAFVPIACKSCARCKIINFMVLLSATCNKRNAFLVRNSIVCTAYQS
jgi:hypothetical protein